MNCLHVHREGNQAFREAMASLENHPCVRGLSFTSFLILPFQRITRLKLLVQVRVVDQDTDHIKPRWHCGDFVSNKILTVIYLQNILKKVEENSEREANAIKAHQRLEQVTTRGHCGWNRPRPSYINTVEHNYSHLVLCTK